MATGGIWGTMFRSPEYRLRSRAQATAKQASAFQQTLAADQWKQQKKQYADQRAATSAGAAGLSGMVNQYNTAYGEAKAANEARYQELLGSVNATTDTRSADIRGGASEESSNMMQRLARLGLSNTTVGSSLQGGINRRKEMALDRSANEFSREKRGIIERRSDEYPQSDIIVQLAQLLGQGAGGTGTGGIVNALSSLQQA